MVPVDLSHCYGCGAENPIGFHLVKSYVEDKAHIEFDVRPEHTGYPRLMHGGITCVLMDEVMYHAIARLGIKAVTVTLAVRYRRPALVGHHLICEAWISEHEESNIEVSAKIVEAKTDAFIAEGKGWFKEADPDELMARFWDPSSPTSEGSRSACRKAVRAIPAHERPAARCK